MKTFLSVTGIYSARKYAQMLYKAHWVEELRHSQFRAILSHMRTHIFELVSVAVVGIYHSTVNWILACYVTTVSKHLRITRDPMNTVLTFA